MYVARTSNNRVILSGNLYCCLLPRCEALCTSRSGFPIATGQHLSKRKTTRNARNLGAMLFGPPSYTYACGWPTWSLQATWCPWAPRWWPLIFRVFSTYHLVWSKFKKSWYMYIRQKNWLKCTDCAELRKITITNCVIYSFFSNPSNFIADRFVWLKKVKVNCTSVLPILFFT